MASRTDKQIEAALHEVCSTTRPELDAQILTAAFAAIAEQKRTAEARSIRNSARQMTMTACERWPRIVFRRWALTSLVVVILVAVGVFLWSVHVNDSWAQVTEAVRDKPWVLMTATDPGGKKNEIWLSMSRDVEAARRGDEISFDDYRLGIHYVYRMKQNRLYRDSDPGGIGQERFNFFRNLFQQLFRGDKILEIPRTISKLEVVEQARKTVQEGKQTWIEYKFAVRVGHAKSDETAGLILIRVDPKTGLPHSMLPSENGQGVTAAEVMFSYPEKGPVDIYDLGVPRDAELVAGLPRVPKDDLRGLLDNIQNSARLFDNCLLRYVSVQDDALWHAGTAMRVWHKGGRSLTENGLLDPDDDGLLEPVADANQDEWWNTRFEELWFRPSELYDGRMLYKNVAFPADWWEEKKQAPLTGDQESWPKPKWQLVSSRSRSNRSFFPALDQVYQTIRLGSLESKVEVVPKPEEGPAGCLLLSIEHQSSGTDGVSRSRQPSDKSLGYCRMSLRDKGSDTRAARSPDNRQNGVGIAVRLLDSTTRTSSSRFLDRWMAE